MVGKQADVEATGLSLSWHNSFSSSLIYTLMKIFPLWNLLGYDIGFTIDIANTTY